jgi:hypothetical protein
MIWEDKDTKLVSFVDGDNDKATSLAAVCRFCCRPSPSSYPLLSVKDVTAFSGRIKGLLFGDGFKQRDFSRSRLLLACSQFCEILARLWRDGE